MVVSTSNKNHIQDNWGKLKCSPIGPYLQMLGLAPGDANDTSNQCKSSEFSSQFNSSMTEHINISSQLTPNLISKNKLPIIYLLNPNTFLLSSLIKSLSLSFDINGSIIVSQTHSKRYFITSISSDELILS